MDDLSALDPGRLTTALAAHADEIGRLIVTAIAREAPVNRHPSPDSRAPGTLRDSFTFETNRDDEGITFDILTSDPEVLRYVRQGTMPYPIAAVNAKSLRFWVAGGVLHFARSVQHPGTEPDEFVLRADEVIQANVRILSDALIAEAYA